MSSTAWKTQTEKVVNLALDDENIRLDLHGKGAAQDALILDLFINQDAFSILQDIARDGLFPHELPIATKINGDIVILEGNRRLAALKAAINPALVPAYSARINALVKSSNNLPITSLEVKVAPSRAVAEPIIAAIHTRSSRKPWAPLRQAYFYNAQIESGAKPPQQLASEFPGVDIPKFIRMWQMHRVAQSIQYDFDDQARKVANQQKFPITTLARLYDDEMFQQAFHISFDTLGQVRIEAEEKSFKAAFKEVVADIVNGIVSSRNLNKKDDIKKHLGRWTLPKAKSGGKPLGASSFKPTPLPKKQKSSKGLASESMICTLPYPALKRGLHELQTIDYNAFPNATHDLLRTFLECSLKAYFDYKKIQVPKKGKWTYLNDVLQLAEAHFQTENTALVQPIRIIINTNNYLHSQDYLNAINHNPSVFSTGNMVKDAWDQMEPVIRYLLDPK